jgi:hypothetical protein
VSLRSDSTRGSRGTRPDSSNETSTSRGGGGHTALVARDERQPNVAVLTRTGRRPGRAGAAGDGAAGAVGARAVDGPVAAVPVSFLFCRPATHGPPPHPPLRALPAVAARAATTAGTACTSVRPLANATRRVGLAGASTAVKQLHGPETQVEDLLDEMRRVSQGPPEAGPRGVLALVAHPLSETVHDAQQRAESHRDRVDDAV